MQEEVKKHTRKIYHTLKSSRHSTAAKIKEIIIEILIIVFAVSLSIWLHGRAEHRHEQKQVMLFLQGLKDDLSEDTSLLVKNKASLTRVNKNFAYLYSLQTIPEAASIPDSIIFDHLKYEITETHVNIGRYDGFKSSGKFETFENDSLKQKILVFYQQTLPDLISGENFTNSLQLKMLDYQLEWDDKKSQRSYLMSNKMQGLFNLMIFNSNLTISEYQETIDEARELISEIEKELGR